MKRFSLYARLLSMTAIPLMLGLIAIGVHSYLTARKEAETIYDAQLAHFAQVIGLLAHHEVEEGNVSPKVIRMQHGESASPYEKDFAYRVWLDDTLILQSENAVGFGAKIEATGFRDKTIHHVLWRFYILRKDNLIIEVAENYHIRRDLVKQVGLSILLPLFLMFPVLVIAMWFGVRYGLLPLHNLSELIRYQTPEQLNLVQVDVTPKEVMPLINAINHLIMQVEEVVEREKRFTRYAAHEMRTPLAALKTQIQVALREKNETLRKELLQDVLTGVDRATHLLEQLLILARAQQKDIQIQRLNFSDIISAVAETFLVVAERKKQQFKVNVAPDMFCNGNAELLSILIRNLLDNACKYSPPNSLITLTLKANVAHDFVLNVTNTSVLFSQEQAARIFEPFYRANDSDIQGAGLGLAIVTWIAKIHHFTLGYKCEDECFTISMVIKSVAGN